MVNIFKVHSPVSWQNAGSDFHLLLYSELQRKNNFYSWMPMRVIQGSFLVKMFYRRLLVRGDIDLKRIRAKRNCTGVRALHDF
jgi:hypothetical protein